RPPSRLRELRAALGWILRSNVEPGDSPAKWEQRAGSRPVIGAGEQTRRTGRQAGNERGATQSSATGQ
ncbi:MAG TPA: hypothetical protein VFA70_04180, partial [Dehalococcoidia bacterium]|nr:hypothetical protein [Dehalococcoidia bacterium]